MNHIRLWKRVWTQDAAFNWRDALACLLGGILLWPLVSLLPMVGWDWFYWFLPGNIQFFPPWTGWVLLPFTALPGRLGLGLLNAVMLMAVAVGVARNDRSDWRLSRYVAAALALLTPQVLMALWLGNIEGLVLLGVITFPPGIVLALMKPNIAGWALLARRKWVVWGLVWGLLSLLIWGLWPVREFSELGRLSQNFMAIGWYNLGWPVAVIGLILLLFSKPDPYQLMAAGFLLTPYLMPNHMLLLLPVLGKVNGWKRIVLWAISWVSGLASGIYDGIGRYLGLVFPIAVWIVLAGMQIPPEEAVNMPLE